MLTIENTISDIINSLKPRCAISNFAVIAGIASPARVATAINGQKPFEIQDGMAHLAVARQLKEIQELSAPLPIDWSETQTIKSILADLKDKQLHIAVYREQPIAKTEEYFVFLKKEGFYFIRRNRDLLGKLQVSGSYKTLNATRVTKQCGEKIIAALATTSPANLIVSPTTSLDGACDDFDSLWGSD